MFSTYVLQSKKDSKLYIGFTSDLKRRMAEHSEGRVTATKNRRPLKLIYFEGHTSEKDARRRERYFKTSSGKSTLKRVLSNALEQVY